VVQKTIDLGYLSVPDGGGPGVVIIHDVWGLYDHFRDIANRLANEGFVALALDLYRSMDSRPRADDPGAFMRELSDPAVLRDVQAAVDALHAHPAVAGQGVGVTGFCMGGSFALLAGALVQRVDAVAAFYGILSYGTGLYASERPLDPAKKPIEPLEAARSLRCPMIAFYGSEDQFVSLEDVSELERRAGSGLHGSQVHVYAGAGHAFVNDTRPQAYRPEAASDAFRHMVTFFRETLARAEPRP